MKHFFVLLFTIRVVDRHFPLGSLQFIAVHTLEGATLNADLMKSYNSQLFEYIKSKGYMTFTAVIARIHFDPIGDATNRKHHRTLSSQIPKIHYAWTQQQQQKINKKCGWPWVRIWVMIPVEASSIIFIPVCQNGRRLMDRIYLYQNMDKRCSPLTTFHFGLYRWMKMVNRRNYDEWADGRKE